MTAINLAIVSPTDSKSIAGILTIYASSVSEALKLVKRNPDMEGVRVYPLEAGRLSEH